MHGRQTPSSRPMKADGPPQIRQAPMHPPLSPKSIPTGIVSRRAPKEKGTRYPKESRRKAIWIIQTHAISLGVETSGDTACGKDKGKSMVRWGKDFIFRTVSGWPRQFRLTL